jgi:hypothetical protein
MVKRSRLSRKSGRLGSVPKRLVPQFKLPDKEFRLVRKGDNLYYFFESPSTGNAVEIAETTTSLDGKNLWLVKKLAQTVQMKAGAPKNYLIVNEILYPDKAAAFRNWDKPFSDEQVPEAVLVKLSGMKTYKVTVRANEYRDGRVIGSSMHTINVYAKNPVQARKHGVEHVSGGQKTLSVVPIPYEQAKAEGEIY